MANFTQMIKNRLKPTVQWAGQETGKAINGVENFFGVGSNAVGKLKRDEDFMNQNGMGNYKGDMGANYLKARDIVSQHLDHGSTSSAIDYLKDQKTQVDRQRQSNP